MTFADQLKKAKGDLTARQVASAVSPLLPVRTVEKWIGGDNEPPAWTRDWIISRVSAPRHDCAPVFTAIKFPKRPRKKKGQNDPSSATRPDGGRGAQQDERKIR